MPYWLVGHWYFISRPVFNIELVLPLLLTTVSPAAALFLLGALWGVDLVVSQSASYHFLSPLAFILSSRFLGDLNLRELVAPIHLVLVLPFLLCAVIAIAVAPRQGLRWRTALAVVVVVAVIDIANGSSMLSWRDTRVTPLNVAGSPMTTLAVRAWQGRHVSPLQRLGNTESATGMGHVADWAKTHPNGSVLLVLVESMGWHRDEAMRRWLLSQLWTGAVREHYSLREVRTKFRGATTYAELRELCDLTGSYSELDRETGQSCLPSRLSRDGWQTIGLHGFSSHMFSRDTWWPLTGLQRRYYAEDLIGADQKQCGGAYAGVCDADLVTRAIEEARRPRTFVYALSLNSHLPLAAMPIPPDLNSTCRTSGVGADVCLLTATIGRMFATLGDELGSKPKDLTVVIVGDHAPPFLDLRERNQYDSQYVPGFILTPSDD